ncbi:hypothetical protein EI94DRAFT_1090863 [Lactarius quietus]|nr:hypothetical protein EI94DRAFT_1090863 [Lactarius quietus]
MTTPHDSRDVEGQAEAPRRRVPDRAIDSRNSGEKHPAREEGKGKDTAGYGDSSATYWELYASEAKISDQKFVDTLIGDTNAMSIMNGIFSSVIATFIQQASQALQPNNSQETVCLLSQLVSQGNSTQLSSQFCPGPYSKEPSAAAIRSNVLLIVSFFLAMAIVVACGLIQQWCHEYMKYAYPRTAPHKRGRVRTYLFQGLNQFHMRNIMYGIRVVLFVSVVLFSCGVSDYLYSLYPRVGLFSWSCVIAAGIVYAALTLFPLIIGNCPYHTALTPPLRFCHMLLLFSGHTVWRWFRRGKEETSSWRKVCHFDNNHFLAKKANTKVDNLDPYAMEWLFTDDDFSDTDMDKFLEGLPGYIHSRLTQAVKEELPKVLTAPYILRRIGEHILTCVTATEPSEEARVKRLYACVESVRVILHLRTSTERLKHPDEEQSLRECMQSIVDDLGIFAENLKRKGTCGHFVSGLSLSKVS